MRAAILKEGKKELVIENIPEPVINDNDVLVKVKACGVCHTDLHYVDHGVKTFKKYPLVLGHEVSGIVKQVGKNVGHLQENDRVIIPAVLTCGLCKYCLTNKENICSDMLMLGNHIDGGYAEYVSVPAKDLKLLPEEISFEEGALIADALSTAYHAVFNKAEVEPGSTVLIMGCGGVGVSIIQMCSIRNAHIIAVDTNNSKLERAKYFGAETTINPTETNLSEAINSLDVDTIFEVIGIKSNIELAVKVAKPSTKICIVGYCQERVLLNTAKVMFYELNIFGSLGCKPKDFETVIELVKNKKLNVKDMISNEYQLDNINCALDDLRFSKGLRPVITFKHTT